MNWRLILSRTAVSATAAVAAIVSYAHLQHVAEVAGEDWRSWLLPVSADGLAVAASLSALQARAARQAIPATTWVSLVVGLAVSIAANMLNAFLPRLTPEEMTVLSAVVAAWPPVALALSFEQLLRLRADAPEHKADTGSDSPAAPAVTVPEHAEQRPEHADTVRTLTEQSPDTADNARTQAIAAFRADPGLSGKKLGEMFGYSDRWGRRIIQAANAASNGKVV